MPLSTLPNGDKMAQGDRLDHTYTSVASSSTTQGITVSPQSSPMTAAISDSPAVGTSFTDDGPVATSSPIPSPATKQMVRQNMLWNHTSTKFTLFVL